MKRYLPAVLLVLHSFGTMVRVEGATDPAAVPPEPQKKSSPAGPILITGAIAVGAGVGTFFLIRHMRRERRTADSIIAVVEQAWRQSEAHYRAEEYRDAVRELQKISASWYSYEKYSAKYRRNRKIHPDSIRTVIASCDFLESMIPTVTSLSRHADSLPADEFALSKMSRHDVQTTRLFVRNSIDSILKANPNHRSGLVYSFRHITRKLHSLDSLVDASYADRKADFAFKNRFYYNRATEQGDTAALRRFVEDCDYYQVDKEWCQRAKLAMEDPENVAAAERFSGVPSGKKMSINDSITAAFQYAMQSKRIEVLEAYIKKYSSRRYRSRRRLAKINEVKAALRQLRTEIEAEVAFNKAYPRFGNGDFDDITVTIKGVSGPTEALFRLAWDSLEQNVIKLSSIRFPASFTIDYTTRPPMLLLDAVVSPENDIEKSLVNARRSYGITCLFPAMNLLHQFKLLSLSMLEKRAGGLRGGPEDIVMNKVASAMYGLRLHSSEGTGSILFYARAPEEGEGDMRFYDFYDITIQDKGRRFPIYPGSLPNIIPSLSSDRYEQKMGAKFFGE